MLNVILKCVLNKEYAQKGNASMIMKVMSTNAILIIAKMTLTAIRKIFNNGASMENVIIIQNASVKNKVKITMVPRCVMD